MSLKSLSVAAVMVLAVTLGAYSQGRFPSEEDKEKIRIRVGMTKDQQAQVEAVFNEERKLQEDSRKKMGELYKQLQQYYDIYDYDKNAAQGLRKDICRLYRERIMIHANAQEKLRKILSKEQFDKMTEMAREMHEKWRKEMESRGGQRGFGRPGNPPGPGPNP